ncbi:MAG TPA: kelch repeat-containing protein [Bacteroidota bacterium]|nr:kelch repeat-containing protein [Bacteroidota bacterium]
MKRLLFFSSLLLLISLSAAEVSAQSQTWTWISGSATSTIVPDFGTRGEFQPTNQPPALAYAAMWTGPDGNLYMFGGDNSAGQYYNTLWEYSPSLKEWMWKRGSNTPNAATNYGTSRYPSESNDPGARAQFGWYATPNGDLWVYGGVDHNDNVFSDLWKYDFATDRWIWYQLWSNSATQNTDTQFPALNSPGTLGARYGSSIYVDPDSSIVWLFCGIGFEAGSLGTFLDVWKVYVDSSKMYWVAGTSNPDDAGTYSYPPDGSEHFDASPSSRFGQSLWRSADGRFYIFGGTNGAGEYLADIWHWNPSTGNWGWEWASNYEWSVMNIHPIYFAKDSASSRNEVSSRSGSAAWMTADSQLAIYGGYGYDTDARAHPLNDYWLFNPTTRLLTWKAGGGPFASSLDPYNFPGDSLKPTYGTKGVAADSVYPGARRYSAATIDNHGTVWLFGGYGYSNTGDAGLRNDLFTLSTPAAGIFAGGSGTSQDPYLVANIAQLQSVNNNRDKYFNITNDIDASSTSAWNSSGLVFRGFEPIGDDLSPFTGYLEGNGHTITGLTINRGSTDAVGLFGRIDGVVRNLRLQNVSVVGDSYVGGLAGRIVGQVDSCSVTGSVTGSGDAVGGLAGDVYSGSVTMSYSSATVTGGIFAGAGTGGLAGNVSSGSALTNCYATGNVTGKSRVGGLVGNNVGTITKTYASGLVTGDSLPGGLVGANTGTVVQSYWSSATSGKGTSAGGTILSLSEIESQGSFLGFNFDSTWVIWQGLSYPAFRSNLQSPPPGLSGIALAITRADSTFQFGSTHIDLKFLGIGAPGNLFGYAEYDNTQSDSISFSGSAPAYYSGYHWVIGTAGSSYSGDTLIFAGISGLPGSPNAGAIMVYYRPAVGTGSFALQAATPVGDSIIVPDAPTGEYIFSSNSAALFVTVAEFSVTGSRRDAELQWKTLTEVGNAGWEVERAMSGGDQTASGSPALQWGDVTLVRGAGSSNISKQYQYTDANLFPGRYSYRLKQLDQSGSFIYSKTVQVDVGLAPRVFDLSQNYPNPFNPTTTIQFTLPADGHVTLKVYDILGRELTTLVDGNMKAGVYQQVTFDGSRYSTGVYFAVLQTGGKQLVKKMMMVK